MQTIFTDLSQDFIIILAAVGFLLGIIFLLLFIYRRLKWLLKIFSKKKVILPNTLASFRNFLFILFWTAIFSIILVVGFFFRSYSIFTREKPIAKIEIEPTAQDQTNRITLTQFLSPDSQITSIFLIKGDQWILEGDVLKWDHLLPFLGLTSRYRLTRIRGRYLRTKDEISKPATVYSLVQDEDHPLWRYLYYFGNRVPFVNSVYGNAVFQTSNRRQNFVVFIGTSGFIIRKI